MQKCNNILVAKIWICCDNILRFPNKSCPPTHTASHTMSLYVLWGRRNFCANCITGLYFMLNGPLERNQCPYKENMKYRT